MDVLSVYLTAYVWLIFRGLGNTKTTNTNQTRSNQLGRVEISFNLFLHRYMFRAREQNCLGGGKKFNIQSPTTREGGSAFFSGHNVFQLTISGIFSKKGGCQFMPISLVADASTWKK